MTTSWVSELARYSEGLVLSLATDGVKYAGCFFAALAITLLLTPLFREVARKVGMVDKPDPRRINKEPIPRGGGLSIFVAFHLVLGVLVLMLGGSVSHQFSADWQVCFLIASSVLVVLGLIDDKRGLPPYVKLAGQIVVALILYGSGVHVGGVMVAFPPWLDCVVTVFWIVGAVNAFNLIDGMDGVAAGLALIASLGLAGSLLFTGDTAGTLPYLVLAGACLGFLRYNFHPASVFLGDSGSMFLGLCIATLPLMTGSRRELITSLGMPLLVMGVPIFDTMLAIWRRSVRALLPHDMHKEGSRGRVMQPDKEHLHHRLLRQTMNQRTAAMTLYGMSAALVVVGLAGTLLKERAPGLFLLAFVAAVFVVVRHLERVELWDTGRWLSGKRGTLRQGLLVPCYILVDVVSLCVVWVIARWVFEMPLSRVDCLTDLPRFVVPVFLALVSARTYWRVWSRAQVRDFVLLCVAVYAGAVISAGLMWLFSQEASCVIRFSVLSGSLAIFPIVMIRLWRESACGVVHSLERKFLLDKPDVLRLLAYGGGSRFNSYIKELETRAGLNDRVILGIIDDDVNLRGRIVAGYRVIGGIDRLDNFMTQQRVDGVIITSLMDGEKQKDIVRELLAKDLRVSIWSCEEKVLSTREGDSRYAETNKGSEHEELS